VLPGLAAHFNTTVDEILKANPIIPRDATTLPAGLPMKIPIYYQPLWGSPFKILPDSLFVDGPAQVGFNTDAFVAAHPGWLKGYIEYASQANRSGADIVDTIAVNYSVSPRLLLALLDYQTGALTSPVPPSNLGDYPLGYRDYAHKGLYMQLNWAANALNNAYYAWKYGQLRSFDLQDGRMVRPDPWLNPASVALQAYFAAALPPDQYDHAVSPQGFYQTYLSLFGDPWAGVQPHIPGSLRQPELRLPFAAGESWAFTGGPHTGWGDGAPYAALDFAPPSLVGGCVPTAEMVTAMAPGVIARADPGLAVEDLDGDGHEQTGWDILYLHLDHGGMLSVGMTIKSGDPLGHPSCEEGRATGTHIHIARKYNGEWLPADSPVPFNLEGWIAHAGADAYLGTLTRYSRTVNACTCSDQSSQIRSEAR
jgi:LasA protease